MPGNLTLSERLDVAEEVGEPLALAVHLRRILADVAGVEATLIGALDFRLSAGQVGKDLVKRGRAGMCVRRKKHAAGGSGSDRGKGLGFGVHGILTGESVQACSTLVTGSLIGSPVRPSCSMAIKYDFRLPNRARALAIVES
jgi:hypothetical protein